MKIKRLGMVGGLVALLGAGCDKDLKTIEASCKIAPGVEANLVYNKVELGRDYPSIGIHSDKTGQLLVNSEVNYFSGNAPIYCIDGQVISWRKYMDGSLIVKKGKFLDSTE